MSEEPHHLPLDDIRGLMNIFCEFIDVFVADPDGEETLTDLTKGLQNLAANSNEESLRYVSGHGLRQELGSNLIGQMVELVGSKNVSIFSNALKYVGGIISSDDTSIADKVILCDGLDKITDILFSP